MTQSSTVKMRIGTRGSPLALAQANAVAAALAAAHGWAVSQVEIRIFKTTGDRITDRVLRDEGGKGLFTKEIEEALLSGEVDLGVHSAKDMQTVLPLGLTIGACLPREDVRDVLITRQGQKLADLPEGAVLGTASLRRQALMKHLRPDLTVVPLRGNVETRLRKIAEGEADATMLALAGLRRLGLTQHASEILDTSVCLPAVGQGAIAIETRGEDTLTRDRVAAINHMPTFVALSAERAFLAVLDGSCRTPIAGHAEISGENIRFRGLIVRPDGSEIHETTREGGLADAVALGADAGMELKQRAGSDFFRDM